jgi:glycosyltransferase involved in cell wall biosynthesis
VVVTHHGADYRRGKWGALGRAALRLGERCAVFCAERVIAVSPAAAADLRTRFPARAERIVFIPNGAPRAAPQRGGGAQIARRLGVANRPFLLSVGRLVPEKGFADLLAAQKRMALIAPPPVVVIAGEADHADGYARRLRAQAGPGVMFAGRLGSEALAELYGSCALFVLASHHEGLPMVALEALGAGAPVLLSDIEANRALGLPQRCYFPMGDVAALAEKLRQPAQNYRAALPDPARFDWSRIARQTAAVYRDCRRPGLTPARASATA